MQARFPQARLNTRSLRFNGQRRALFGFSFLSRPQPKQDQPAGEPQASEPSSPGMAIAKDQAAATPISAKDGALSSPKQPTLAEREQEALRKLLDRDGGGLVSAAGVLARLDGTDRSDERVSNLKTARPRAASEKLSSARCSD